MGKNTRLHFFRALPLPASFTTEQNTVEASLFVTRGPGRVIQFLLIVVLLASFSVLLFLDCHLVVTALPSFRMNFTAGLALAFPLFPSLKLNAN